MIFRVFITDGKARIGRRLKSEDIFVQRQESETGWFNREGREVKGKVEVNRELREGTRMREEDFWARIINQQTTLIFANQTFAPLRDLRVKSFWNGSSLCYLL